jgi:tetratricopeptide (TPR) repeat protein
MRPFLQCLVLIACTMSSARADVADPFPVPKNAEARAHLVRGNKLYSLRRFQEAIAEYQAGTLIEAAAIFEYDLGQANRQLQNYQEAIWYYEQYLNHWSPTGEVRDAVIAFIAEMKAHLENKTQKMPPTEPAPPMKQAAAASGEASSSKPSPLREPQDPSRDGAWYTDGWGWALAGSGVAVVSVGGVLLASASGLAGDANGTTNQQERDRLRDKEHSRNVWGTITAVAGVGLLATGVVKLAIHRPERAKVARWDIGISKNRLFILGSF